MNPVQVVGGFLSGFFQYLQQKRVQGQIHDAYDMIEAVNNWVGRAITAIAGTMYQEQGAVEYSDRYAQQIGHDFEQIQGTHQRYWNKLFDVIIPHSLAHLVGYVYSDGIVPLRAATRSLQEHVISDEGRLNVLEGWRHQWVDPNLSHLLNWMRYVQDTDQPAIDVLRDWLAHPGVFGDWAAAPVTGPIIAYLAAQGHERSRDNLSRIMVGAWQEVPNDVWELILQFAVTTK